jgi:lipid-A-disaccharide synthase
VRLVLSAGESSGDQIAADLARALIEQHPGIELAGLAGPEMQAAGVEAWFDLDELNVMGLSEILRHLPRLVRLRREFEDRIVDWAPDAFIGIDAPDFNLGLARRLKRRDVRTIHYVSPSVWAWRAGRIPKIARSLDLMLTLFPFEPELYRPHGLTARFVGHHLADRLAEESDRSAARQALDLVADRPVIALLPGSRASELRQHAGLLAETAKGLRESRPDVELLILLARERDKAVLGGEAIARLDGAGVRWQVGRTRQGLRAADLALAASGTVTLEAFLLGCPLVVFYRIAPSTYWMARTLRLVKSPFVALPNILTQSPLVPECLQHEATPRALIREAEGWMSDPERVDRYRELASEWAQRLAIGAGDQAARAILSHLEP